MSMSEPQLKPAKEWPPLDLIAELGLDKPAEPEYELDPAILRELPAGTDVLSIKPSGASAWVQTVRIETRQPGGQIKSFFRKNQKGEVGRRMMQGSFESEKAFFSYIPENIPKPIAWGNYESDKDMWFFLAEYHEMIDEVPDIQQFVSVVVKFHQDSMGKSPDDRFGFHVPTHLAKIPNDNGWEDTWAKFFTKAMKRMMELETVTHGKDDQEFEELKEQFLAKVMPRLLGPLESGGRKVVPCLVHSDLWPGNCMPDAETDEVMFFDSCAFWGHNEADLGSWRAPRYRMGEAFLEEYRKRMTPSFPEDDWEDRNALYAMRYDLLNSALFPNSDKFRNQAREEMKRMVDTYPDGFEGWQVSGHLPEA